MTRPISSARLARLEALPAFAPADDSEAREATISRVVALVVAATGISDELVPTPQGWRYCYARSAHAFTRSLPIAVLRSLFAGDDVSDAYPLHARAWRDPDSLSREEWRTINTAPRVW